MHRLKNLLKDPSFLSEAQRIEVLRFLWLLEQVKPSVRKVVEQGLEGLLEAPMDAEQFMAALRKLSGWLEAEERKG